MHALRAQVARCTGDAAGAGFDALLLPLLEAVVRSKAAKQRDRAWRLLDWLLAQASSAALGDRLWAACTHADKRVRLGAALAARHACERAPGAATLPPVCASAELPAACAALTDTVAREGTTVGGAPAPTRLTAACADAVLCASAALCAAASGADAARVNELLWQLAPSLEALARALAAWGCRAGAAQPLRTLALLEAARHVANVIAHGQSAETSADAAREPEPDSDDEGEASALALPPRAAACAALSACWLHYAPFIMCEPHDGSIDALAASAARWLSTLASACAAGTQGEVSQRRAEAAQLHALTCIGMLAAAAESHPDGGSAALEAQGWVAAPRALMEALCSPNERITALAVASLRTVLLPSGGVAAAFGERSGQEGWGARAQAALDALVPLLDERDGVSRAGVALAVRCAHARTRAALSLTALRDRAS